MPKIGHFEILELIGRGAMGAVYRAVDPLIGRVVAIKNIRLIGYSDDEEAAFLRDRLLKEARAAGGLSHPGIVTVYQLGTHETEAYIVMEYIDGATLESCLVAGKPFDPAVRSRVLLDVAAALDYAHERGIVHRDIKPANIMVTGRLEAPPTQVKIMDFGIAKTMLGHTLTPAGMVCGTPSYMSPEQVSGAQLDGRSDQFALAAIAYEMLAGRKAFDGDTVTSICYQIATTRPTPIAEINPELPPAVGFVLERAMDKDPAKRFPSCSEFAASLLQACAPREAEIAVPPATLRKPPSRFRWKPAAVACACLLGVSAWTIRPGVKHQEPVSAATEVSTGLIVWTGQAKRGTLLSLDNAGASTGHVVGALPNEPVDITVYPAEQTSRGLTVFTTDDKQTTQGQITTPAGPAVFSWDPRRILDATISEAPGSTNQWQRLVLRVNRARLTACVIEWKKKAK